MKEDCYCSIPTRVMIGAEDRKVRKISCGSAHTACVTEAGNVYTFGCGDGGRWGLDSEITILATFLFSSMDWKGKGIVTYPAVIPPLCYFQYKI